MGRGTGAAMKEKIYEDLFSFISREVDPRSSILLPLAATRVEVECLGERRLIAGHNDTIEPVSTRQGRFELRLMT